MFLVVTEADVVIHNITRPDGLMLRVIYEAMKQLTSGEIRVEPRSCPTSLSG